MRRLLVLVAVVAVPVLALVALGRSESGVVAQDATPGATAAHPLVGSWLADTEADNPDNPPSLIVVHADGTYLEADVDGVAVGVWEPTGERTANLTFRFHTIGEDGAVVTGIVRAAVEVAPDGQSFTAPYTIEFTGIPGMPAGEVGPGTATGTRLAVEPMGTPVASFEEAFGAFEASPEATPAG